MVFSSHLFLLYFFPVFLLLYHFVGKAYKNGALLAASILFYAWGAPKFVFLLLGSTVLDFYLVRAMHKSTGNRQRKTLLVLSVCLNLGLLLYFKYANFFVENVNTMLGSVGMSVVNWTAVALPIGISFYTFQTLTYSVDVYRKVHLPLDRLGDYLLYIMSFPQMIAGPIVRFHTIADQIVNRKETIDDKLLGLLRFLIGLAKKVLIANVLGEQADYILGMPPGDISPITAWIGIFAYSFQIYFDFSGYSDMAIGIGRMLGFTFPENFDNPYIAQNISEFWRRWHITLGQWMRDYLYIPLGGNRVNSNMRLYLNLWLVFLISGLWHGASWNFVIWGAYHGLFLILDRLFFIRFLRSLGRFPSIVLTFLIVTIGWVFFRLPDFDQALRFLQTLFFFSAYPDELYLPNSFYFFFGLAALFAFSGCSAFGKKIEQLFYYQKQAILSSYLSLYAIALMLLLLCISSISSADYNPFIYFRF
jgi:alginate O-acetyltransferase complex protein AlgI